MSKDLIKAKNTALPELASRLSVDTKTLQNTLKATAFKDCKTNEQFISAVVIANTYKLNPLLKELYAFPGKGGSVIPIVSLDGWVSLVNRQKDFDGVSLTENEDPESAAGLKSVTAKFFLKNKSQPIEVTEYMAECYNDSKEPWRKWPRRMLRHKAYIQGARIAFGFSGIYDQDEADRIVEAQEFEEVEISGKPTVEKPQEIEDQIEHEDQTQPITGNQLKRLFAIAKDNGYTSEEVSDYVKDLGYEHTNELSKWDYPTVIEDFSKKRIKQDE